MATRGSRFSYQIDINVNPTPDEISRFLPLRQAILRGDMESVKRFLDKNPDAKSASITERSDTPLMIAMSGHRFELIQYLLELLPKEDLAKRNREGNTALHEATIVGHVRAARLLVQADPSLLSIRNNYDQQPLHTAAANCQGEILRYLILRINEVENQLKDLERGIVMNLAMDARLFDVAMILLERTPSLAYTKWEDVSPLEIIAEMPTAFPSGTNLNI